MSSKFIHVVIYVRISFLFKDNNIPLYIIFIYVYVYIGLTGICNIYLFQWILGLHQHFNCCEKRCYDHAKSLQSCPTLCDPIDGSPPGSPVPGILQARTLEWVMGVQIYFLWYSTCSFRYIFRSGIARSLGFLSGTVLKNLLANAGDSSSIPGLGGPLE